MLKLTFKYFSFLMVFAIQNPCIAQIATFDGVQPAVGVIEPALGGFQPVVSAFQPSFAAVQPALGTVQPAYDAVQPAFAAIQPVFDAVQPAFGAIQPAFDAVQPTFSIPQVNSGPLGTFVSTFSNAIDSSAVLSELCNPNQVTIQDFAQYLYRAIFSQLYGGIYPSEFYALDAKPAAKNAVYLTRPVLVNILANSLGNHLLAQGILNDMNAASLSSSLVQGLETSAQRAIGMNDPRSRFESIVDACIGFMRSQNQFTIQNVQSFVRHLGKEIQLAGGKARNSRRHGNKAGGTANNGGWNQYKAGGTANNGGWGQYKAGGKANNGEWDQYKAGGTANNGGWGQYKAGGIANDGEWDQYKTGWKQYRAEVKANKDAGVLSTN